jgi:hypothetical protein
MRRSLLALFVLALVSSTASAQVKRGTWQGSATSQQGSNPLVISLDSTSSGWSGVALAQGDSIRLVQISVRADTLEFGIPFNGTVVGISGLVAEGKFSGSMWFNNQNVGTVELTRKAEAEKKP